MSMDYLRVVNESTKNRKQYYGNGADICALGKINVVDKKKGTIEKIEAIRIVEVVDEAFSHMKREYPYLYIFLDSCKVIYVPIYPCRTCETMQVDTNNNLWINLNFVYSDCNMDKDNVFGILFHELFHILLNHLNRFHEMFPKEVRDKMSDELFSVANVKSNLAMDYEINSSMVVDGIVPENFWKKMGGLYKKEYNGETWEDIYSMHGDKEYREWLLKNGSKINEDELAILEAVEKAAKVLNDPTATDEDKAKANKELQKTIDKILGKNKENEIQDAFEKLKNTQLSSFGDIENKLQDVIDDLYRDPSKMSEEQFNELLKDIDQLAKEMAKNTSNISDRFGKSEEDTFEDIKKMRKTVRECMDKLRNEKMSKSERQSLADKIKDSLEDIYSNDVDKEKNEKKRKDRDDKRAQEIKEEFKEKHPLRKLINVFKNLMNLYGDPYYLVCEKSHDIMEDIIDILDPLTEKNLSEITKDDMDNLKYPLEQLKDSFFTDLKKLLDDKVLINKTEEYLHKLLNHVFDFVDGSLFEDLLKSSLDDSAKKSTIKMCVEKLRMIGQILKTQKPYRASDEFKEGYREMRDDLISLFKKDKKEVLKKLYKMGLIDDFVVETTFDKRSKALYDELVKNNEI